MTLAVGVLPMSAQETYETAPIATHDLNGTARYVGMGGAMEALGADLSTISSNPAGLGLFRRSSANISGGLVMQSDAHNFSKGNKTNASFDQAGFVYTMRNSRNSFLNFGFNYHKSKNFDQILTAADAFHPQTVNGRSVYNSSQNKTTWQKVVNGAFTSNKDLTYKDLTYSILDNLYMTNVNTMKDESGKESYVYYPASEYNYGRSSTGYIGEYDFNVSGNLHDRVYLGATIGLYDVHYKNYSEYSELMADNYEGLAQLSLQNDRQITGSGFDVKVGAIFRPIENSPFRIGLYISSPTIYDLTVKGNTTLGYDMTATSLYKGGASSQRTEPYDFKFQTPWKFGLSLGHTVGNVLALGATYEYEDYGSCDMQIIDGYDYNGYDWDEHSSSDEEMNRNIKQSLKGVSTLKLGAEFKATPALAIRVGYNYESAMYDKNGMKGVYDYKFTNSPGLALSTSTDYTNWKSTNRFTCGLGYTIGQLNFDMAYQYSCTNGDFYPFTSLTIGSLAQGDTATEGDNVCNAYKVSNKRHQLLFTIGYKF